MVTSSTVGLFISGHQSAVDEFSTFIATLKPSYTVNTPVYFWHKQLTGGNLGTGN
jgi:hypothetical protein